MKTAQNLLMATLLAAAISAPAMAGVEVTFTDAEHYTDAKMRAGYGKKEREEVLAQIRGYLERLGARHLAPNQTLKIEVLDIDLAGHVEWWNSSYYDVRILRDITSPSMKVRYTLEQDGKTVTSGEELIADRNYLMGISVTAHSADTFRYEKAMLNDWFRKRFAKSG